MEGQDANAQRSKQRLQPDSAGRCVGKAVSFGTVPDLFPTSALNLHSPPCCPVTKMVGMMMRKVLHWRLCCLLVNMEASKLVCKEFSRVFLPSCREDESQEGMIRTFTLRRRDGSSNLGCHRE